MHIGQPNRSKAKRPALRPASEERLRYVRDALVELDKLAAGESDLALLRYLIEMAVEEAEQVLKSS